MSADTLQYSPIAELDTAGLRALFQTCPGFALACIHLAEQTRLTEEDQRQIGFHLDRKAAATNDMLAQAGLITNEQWHAWTQAGLGFIALADSHQLTEAWQN